MMEMNGIVGIGRGLEKKKKSLGKRDFSKR